MNAPESCRRGRLIVNADDWGRDRETTDRTLECVSRGAVSSVSAMVLMQDSERAATIAKERGIDTGLHLNLTTAFSGAGVPARLAGDQARIAAYLRRHRLAQAIFHPGLSRAFKDLVTAQYDEFRRLYGTAPERIDGHHHMHLCSNVVFGKLLAKGALVRRNFSFQSGEKGAWNRLYRSGIDQILAKRHRLTDFFFSLPPLDPSRMQRIFSLADRFTVEVETHPVKPDEYRFLAGGEIFRWAGALPVASRYLGDWQGGEKVEP